MRRLKDRTAFSKFLQGHSGAAGTQVPESRTKVNTDFHLRNSSSVRAVYRGALLPRKAVSSLSEKVCKQLLDSH